MYNTTDEKLVWSGDTEYSKDFKKLGREARVLVKQLKKGKVIGAK